MTTSALVSVRAGVVAATAALFASSTAWAQTAAAAPESTASRQDIQITFAAQVGDRPFKCGERYEGVGLNKATILPMIKRLDPTFDTKDHGHANMSEMLKALDAVVEANRRVEVLPAPVEEELKTFAATLAEGTPVSVVRLSARNPWVDGLAALYGGGVVAWAYRRAIALDERRARSFDLSVVHQ